MSSFQPIRQNLGSILAKFCLDRGLIYLTLSFGGGAFGGDLGSESSALTSALISSFLIGFGSGTFFTSFLYFFFFFSFCQRLTK